MEDKFDYAVFIGRFTPFHTAHYEILERALEIAQNVIVVVGSHKKARDINNPFSSEERIGMIKAALKPEERERITFVPIRDYYYNETQWVIEIQERVREITDDCNAIALIGHESDRSSYYLKLFPQWEPIDFPAKYPIHATTIREKMYTMDVSYKNHVHPATANYLAEFCKTETFTNLKEEFEFTAKYKELWRGAPFTPTFVTVDAVVLKSGHVLLVRRKGNPGKGLLALPGGFLNANEFIKKACVRELREETGIKINAADLEKSIVADKVFDHPSRSIRGRTISHSHFINLGMGELPSVKGSSDADKAFWLPVNEIYAREDEFFEDHIQMVRYFLSKA